MLGRLVSFPYESGEDRVPSKLCLIYELVFADYYLACLPGLDNDPGGPVETQKICNQ